VIQAVALGAALAEADHKVREAGGNNRGPRIREYLKNVGFAEGAPWCAAFVQYCADVAARGLGVVNPLDDVVQEALVQSYYDRLQGSEIAAEFVKPGDLALFKFSGSERWNHIGFVAQPPRADRTTFWTVEGNTGDVDQRDGDGVYLKPRDMSQYPTCFIAWDGRDRE
jgi:hypothetical protein